MTISLQIPDELALQAAQRGLDVTTYIEQILKEAAASLPSLPPSPRLTKEEIAECFATLGQFSSQIPDLNHSTFTREEIYADHD